MSDLDIILDRIKYVGHPTTCLWSNKERMQNEMRKL